MSTASWHPLSGFGPAPVTAAGPRSWWRALRGARRPERDLAADVAEARALARHVRDSDPGFAADLIAAADRHEREAG